jgi:hypothetical protein
MWQKLPDDAEQRVNKVNHIIVIYWEINCKYNRTTRQIFKAKRRLHDKWIFLMQFTVIQLAKTFLLLWNPNTYYHDHKRLITVDPNLGHFSNVPIFTTYFSKMSFKTTLSPIPRPSLFFCTLNQNFICISYFDTYATCLSITYFFI